MEISVAYKDLQDRQIKVTEQESKGLRMTQDNFDPDWNESEEPHGTMVFTDEPELKPVATAPTRNLFTEIEELKARIIKLEGR